MHFSSCTSLLARLLGWLESYYLHWNRLPQAPPTLAFALDLTRPKSELLLENALLFQQVLILQYKSANRTSFGMNISGACFDPPPVISPIQKRLSHDSG